MSWQTFTVDQVAVVLGCSVEKVREALNTGDLPGLKYGRDWVIPCDALDKRLVEKALEEAAERRAAKPSTVEIVMAATKRRQARTPPPLG